MKLTYKALPIKFTADYNFEDRCSSMPQPQPRGLAV